jgi:hypothetical protein
MFSATRRPSPWAYGAAAETFSPSESNRENFSNFAEFERLYAGEERVAMKSYAPCPVRKAAGSI